MDGVKISYILTGGELAFLFAGAETTSCAPKPCAGAAYFIGKYLTERSVGPDPAGEIIAKGLAKTISGVFTPEPVLDFIIKAALASETVWEARGAESRNAAVIFGAGDIYLRFAPYPRIAGAWMITAYPDKKSIEEETGGAWAEMAANG